MYAAYAKQSILCYCSLPASSPGKLGYCAIKHEGLLGFVWTVVSLVVLPIERFKPIFCWETRPPIHFLLVIQEQVRRTVWAVILRPSAPCHLLQLLREGGARSCIQTSQGTVCPVGLTEGLSPVGHVWNAYPGRHLNQMPKTPQLALFSAEEQQLCSEAGLTLRYRVRSSFIWEASKLWIWPMMEKNREHLCSNKEPL